MKGVIHRLTNMIEMKFAVIKELPLLLPVTQIGTSRQLNRITAESFPHTFQIVDLSLCMYPLIEEKVGYIS